jgi:hypothetical protein
MSSRVSVSQIRAAGVTLSQGEAVAIVRELCRQITAGVLRGMPSIHVIRLSADGTLAVEGPIAAHAATVVRAAELLEQLLTPDGADRATMSGPLRLAVLRAHRRIDLPPFAGFEELSASLERFSAEDCRAVVQSLYARWHSTGPEVLALPAAPATVLAVPLPAPAPLTISDVRRARRATGLTLREVAVRSRVPAPLLRELEWGYLWNWPGGHYGRSQLVRYARAAKLDERFVLDAAWPLLEAIVDVRGGDVVDPIPAEVPAAVLLGEDPRPVVVEAIPEVVVEPPTDILADTTLLRTDAVNQPKRHRWQAASVLAAAAVLAVTFMPDAGRRYAEERFFHLPAIPAAPQPLAGVTAASHPAAIPVREAVETSSPTPEAPAAASEVPIAAVPPQPQPRTIPAVERNAAYSPLFYSEGSAMFFKDEGTLLKVTRVVDDTARNFHARSSPDGSRVAFDSDRAGERAVYVADADGHHVRRISGDGFAALPSWSPDGRRLAFVKAEPQAPGVWNIWIADLTSGNLDRVTSYADGQPLGASWFPGGSRIAFGHGDELVVLDLTSHAQRTFESPLPHHIVRVPAVSPDGGRVVFQVDRDGTWLLTIGSGSMRKVLDDPTAGEYTWAPDGSRVAFHSERVGGWGIWVVGQ